MARRNVRSAGLSSLATPALRAELARRERQVRALIRRRNALLKKAATLDAQIRQTGDLISGGARPHNDQNLVQSLRALLKDKTMSVTAAASAVQKAGYRTSAANFRVIVNAALLKKQFFKRVSRGQYTSV